jgi:HlyD family secretion protein
MTKKRVMLLSSVLLIIVIVIVTMSMKSNNKKGISVRTAKVDRQRIIETVSATGVIQPEIKVKISADVAAKITRLEVKEGQWVEKGQLLVQLDRERFLAAVERAEASLRATEANANLVKENMIKTEKDYLRVKELYDKKLESQAAMDQGHAAYQVEKARYQAALEQVDQAKASLKQSSDDFSKTTIYAPMAGTISQLNKEVGEIALGSQFQEDVIMVVSNLTGMEALVDVDENDIVSVQLGDSATIEVDAIPDVLFNGIVSEIASSAKITASGTADQKTEFEVKISITEPGEKLRPGMTASSDIVTQIRDNTLVVPIQSVAVRTTKQLENNTNGDDVTDSQKPKYLPDKDGFVQVIFIVNINDVEARQVNTGIQSETHIEVIEGLNDDEEIVIGNYRAISQLLQNHSIIYVQEENEDSLAAANY